MPTGYTYPVCEGKMTELKDFVLSCCRAFGACADMRDADANAEIPEEFKPSSYHANAIESSAVNYEKLRNMSDGEAADYGQELKRKAIRSASEGHADEQAQSERLARMTEKVSAWTPPTEEHSELKKFMLAQLAMSTSDSTYWTRRLIELESRPASYYFIEALSSAKSAISYHAEKFAEDVKRAQDRTNWMKAVRESLK